MEKTVFFLTISFLSIITISMERPPAPQAGYYVGFPTQAVYIFPSETTDVHSLPILCPIIYHFIARNNDELSESIFSTPETATEQLPQPPPPLPYAFSITPKYEPAQFVSFTQEQAQRAIKTTDHRTDTKHKWLAKQKQQRKEKK